MYIYILCSFAHTYTHTHTHTHVRTYIYMYIFIHTHTHTHTHTYIYIYIYMLFLCIYILYSFAFSSLRFIVHSQCILGSCISYIYIYIYIMFLCTYMHILPICIHMCARVCLWYIYPTETLTNADYADELALILNTPAQAQSLLHCQEHAAGSIGFYMNAKSTCVLSEKGLSLL